MTVLYKTEEDFDVIDVTKLGLQWSEPEPVYTKTGTKYLYKCIIPDNLLTPFLNSWNKHKRKLKLKGYSVKKTPISNVWVLEKWSTKEPYKLKIKIDVNTLKEDTVPNYELKNKQGLLDYQYNSVERLVSSIIHFNSGIDGSDTGIGKSYIAIAVARELGMKVGVVCPTSVVTPWKRVIEDHFKMKYSFVENYEILRCGSQRQNVVDYGWHKWNGRDKKFFKWNVPKDTLIIFDEAHKLKGHDSLQSKLALNAYQQGYKTLFLTATVAINPLELKTVGKILKIYDGDFWKWAIEHGCERTPLGYQFNNNELILKKLHKDLFLTKGVRVNKNNIKDFPDCDLFAISYDLENKNRVNTIYKQMDKELSILAEKQKKDKDHHFTVSQRARQKAELLKVPLFAELVNDSINNGMSVAVFLNYTESVKALSKLLKTDCIVWGEESNKSKRQKSIDDFQADISRKIILNSAAGGTGVNLHDLNGNFPRMALISPGYSAEQLKQILGRVWRAKSKTKASQRMVFLAGTIEETVCNKLKDKLKNMDLINDGDLCLGNERLFHTD